MVNNAPLLPSSDSDHVDALLFLIGEAEVADTGDYAAWLEFMATEVQYSMPVRTTRNRVNPDVAPARSFLLKEDRASLTLRVKRLLESDSVWSENPASRVRRFVSNIRVRRADDGLVVGSYLLLLRSRSDRDTYEILSADRRDLLVRDSTGTLRLAAREITIDQSRLGMANLPFPI